jgi:hypothetical protein
MRLRDQQLQALEDERRRDFRSRLRHHLRKHHPDRLSSFSDEQLDVYIETSRERAGRQYGLSSEQALVCYAQLPLLLGDAFEVDAKLSAIPAILAQRFLDQSTRAKFALSLAYHVAEARRI